MKKIIVLALLLAAQISYAQNGQVLEEIVAVVGENIVLKTDLETEYLQAKGQVDFYDGDLKCEILNQLIIQKLYLHQGSLDSVTVMDERVNAEVDRRVSYYAAQIGGEANLEKYLGKSLEEYKQVMRPKVKEQMIIQQVQQLIIKDVTVSPTDVRLFFADLPKDSLPTFEKEVEVAQIVMAPEPNAFAKEYAYETIKEIRENIIEGKTTFAKAARDKSDDKGTAVNGGELGYFGRGKMVSEFERAVFKLKPDSISGIIETEFGYHIIQVIDRKGEKINARHILIKPLIVNSDYDNVRVQMERILGKLKSDSITLCKAASEYSSDEYTKANCGFFTDPNTGSFQVSVEMLDPTIVAKLNTMKEGNYAEPVLFQQPDGTRAYRLLYLRKVVPAHQANMKDDYQKIQNLALEKKQDDAINEWVKKYKSGVYVWIDDKYVNCEELKGWSGLSE